MSADRNISATSGVVAGTGARDAGDAAMQVRSVSKHYGGLEVLSDVDVTIDRGAFYGIVGPNGAGKTTLLNVISGVVKCDRGEVWVDDVDLTRLGPDRRVLHGVARTFQTVRLVPGRTVLDQVVFGAYDRMGGHTWRHLTGQRAAIRQMAEIRGDAEHLLEQLGMGGKLDAVAEMLPYGDQRRVEVARALMARPKVLLLDEPAAGMGPKEWMPLVEYLLDLTRNGLTVVLIEHNMKLVESACERVVVLDFGKVLAEGPPRECLRTKEVREAYFGTGKVSYGRRAVG